MKKASIGLAAAAALTLSAGTALADGYGYGSPKDAMPIADPQVNWNGLYIGAAVGYGIASAEVELGEGSINFDGVSSEGFQGIVSVGYDRLIHPNIVLGVFADYAFGDLETDLTVSGSGEVFGAEITDSWAIGARLGLIRSCCTMWYVAAGYAQADLDWKVSFGEDSISGGKGMDGWFIGGGIEHQLMNNIFLKLDYRYTDYGKVRWVDEDDIDIGISTDTDVHSVRLGVNWKVDLFGGHHAMASEPLK